MIAAIVLAAGLSSRLGYPKQLLNLGEQFANKRLIEVVVDQVLASEVEQVLVVLGHQAQQIRELLQDKELNLIFNSDYRAGLSSSVKAGVEAIKEEETLEGILFLPGDLPYINTVIINKLLKVFLEEKPLILVPEYKGCRGNPTIFNVDLLDELSRVSGDKGGRELIAKYDSQVEIVKVDSPAIHFDIDRAEDYQRLLKEGMNYD